MQSCISVALVLLVMTTGGRAADAGGPKPTLAQLSWLAGSWSFAVSDRVVTEHWLPPAGGTMLGMSRTIAGERTVAYEFVVLRADANGDIFYDAHPSGQDGASFKLVGWGPSEVVFENLENDFPQRVIYRLSGEGHLDAAIEGTKNGQTRRVEFPYRRAAM